MCRTKDVRILYTLDFEIYKREELRFWSIRGRKEQNIQYSFFLREEGNIRPCTCSPTIDSHIDTLLNQLTIILPIIIHDDHGTWSDAKRTRWTWSQSTITGKLYGRVKFRIIHNSSSTIAFSSSTIKRVSTYILGNYMDLGSWSRIAKRHSRNFSLPILYFYWIFSCLWNVTGRKGEASV